MLDLSTLDELLGELEIEEANSPDIIEDINPEEERHLETEIVKEEIYASQKTTTETSLETPIEELDDLDVYEVTVDEPTSFEVSFDKAEKVAHLLEEKTKIEERAPRRKRERIPRDLMTLESKFFILDDRFSGDIEANKNAVISMKPLQKKIAEKFDNIFVSIAMDRAPSTFIVDCFQVLYREKTVTSSQLVAALRSGDYSEGTARSQVGQIMMLFALVGIATRSNQTLQFNEHSVIADRLKTICDLK
jgi:hypothetical protein